MSFSGFALAALYTSITDTESNEQSQRLSSQPISKKPNYLLETTFIRLYTLPQFVAVLSFAALSTVHMFSISYLRLLVFPLLATDACMLSCSSQRFEVFPRLALVTCFPTLSTGYMFSRAKHWLHVFPLLAPDTCFPALSTSYMFRILIGLVIGCVITFFGFTLIPIITKDTI